MPMPMAAGVHLPHPRASFAPDGYPMTSLQRRLPQALRRLDRWTSSGDTGKRRVPMVDDNDTAAASDRALLLVPPPSPPLPPPFRRRLDWEAYDAVEQIYQATLSAGRETSDDLARFVETLLAHNGVPRLLTYVGALTREEDPRRQNEIGEDEIDEGDLDGESIEDDDDDNAAVAVQRVGQILAHCLYYSQASDGGRLRRASAAAARAVLSGGGVRVLLRASSSNVVAAGRKKICGGGRGGGRGQHNAVAALWTALNNLTLFGDVMLECRHDDKRALVRSALDCLEGAEAPETSGEGGEISRDTTTNFVGPAAQPLPPPAAAQPLPLCSIFGVLTNLLAQDGPAPDGRRPAARPGAATPLERLYVECGAVDRCLRFLRLRGQALYQPGDRHLLVRVLDFFHQCTRRPAVETAEIGVADYHLSLVPLCVDGIRSLQATAVTVVGSGPGPDAVVAPCPPPDLHERVHSHACIILQKATRRMAADGGATATTPATATAPARTAGTGRLLTRAGVATALGLTLDRPTSSSSVGYRWTRELARAVLKQITALNKSEDG